MPLIDPNDNELMNGLINSVPGLAQELAAEGEEQGADVDPGDLYDLVRKQASELYPVDPLTEDEGVEFSQLTNRMRRLAPIEPAQFGDVGSDRIAGNPYSIDTRGAAKGVRNLVGGIINRVRDKRKDGIEDRYTDLAEQRSTNVSNEASANEYLEKMFSKVLEEEQTASRSKEKDTRKIEFEDLRQKNRKKFEKIRQENRREIANANNKDGGGSVTVSKGFVERAQTVGNQLFEEVNAIDEMLNDPLKAPDSEDEREALMEERDKKYKLGFEFMQLGGQSLKGNVNEEAQGKFEELLDEQNSVSAIKKDTTSVTDDVKDGEAKAKIDEKREDKKSGISEKDGEGDIMSKIFPEDLPERARRALLQLFGDADDIDRMLNDPTKAPDNEEERKALMDERDNKSRLGYEFMQLGGQAVEGNVNEKDQDKFGKLLDDFEELRKMNRDKGNEKVVEDGSTVNPDSGGKGSGN